MKTMLAILIFLGTAALIGIAWIQSGGLASHEISSGRTPEEAVQALMADIQARNFNAAYARLADTSTRSERQRWQLADVLKSAKFHRVAASCQRSGCDSARSHDVV
jgi:hypothetical protein